MVVKVVIVVVDVVVVSVVAFVVVVVGLDVVVVLVVVVVDVDDVVVVVVVVVDVVVFVVVVVAKVGFVGFTITIFSPPIMVFITGDTNSHRLLRKAGSLQWRNFKTSSIILLSVTYQITISNSLFFMYEVKVQKTCQSMIFDLIGPGGTYVKPRTE